MKINKDKIVPRVMLALIFGFACHYYFADVEPVKFNTTMKLEDRSCGESGCTIKFMGAFDQRTKIVFIEEDDLFENKIVYTKDTVLNVEGVIKYRKLRSQFWMKEGVVISKVDGRDVHVEEDSTSVFKIFKKLMVR